MPPGKVSKPESVVLSVRVTPAERDLLDKWAGDESRTLSSLIRSWIAERASQHTVETLIARSSLGTPAAKALRGRAPSEVVDRIMEKVEQRRVPCRHPIGRRIAGQCADCGEKVGK